MRIKSKLWVQGYLRRCQADHAPAQIAASGDTDAGAIYIKIALLDGTAALYAPVPAGFSQTDLSRQWSPAFDDQPRPEADIDAFLTRTRDFDPDIWVIEVEAPDGAHRLGDELYDGDSDSDSGTGKANPLDALF